MMDTLKQNGIMIIYGNSISFMLPWAISKLFAFIMVERAADLNGHLVKTSVYFRILSLASFI